MFAEFLLNKCWLKHSFAVYTEGATKRTGNFPEMKIVPFAGGGRTSGEYSIEHTGHIFPGRHI
jgi:hypothetical protein